MLKTQPTSRIRLVASASAAGAKPADPGIRRFRLARLHLDRLASDAARSSHGRGH